ncbi:MAG: hypothetical protein JO261_14760 [Alphaproteobacteria bacterium]|nr:hypothetical protein [Alphaproteobacteria bacterium]MBV9694956.1 hypothetical protein [Alphaproteobacteria bacterium]
MSDTPESGLRAAGEDSPKRADARWKFLRDVAVFELKLALNNLHNFFQIPLTMAVAAVDLVFKHGEEGSRFYWLVEQGRLIDDHIDIYSIVDHRERGLNKDYTVDAVLKRLETVIVREYEKGGTAASVKNAVDRAFDEMQSRTAPASEKAARAAQKAAEKVRDVAEKLRPKDGEN